MDFASPPTDPMPDFSAWFDEAERMSGLPNPNAASLATVDPSTAQPSSRIVLIKKIESRSVLFYTNYNSRKGREIAANANVALTLFWDPLNRQVRLEGAAEKISAVESDSYFNSRPRESRIGALASDQSGELRDRDELQSRVDELISQYPGNNIPRPEHWGGYRVTIHRIELWQGQPHRLHDRILYEWDDASESWSWRWLWP